MAKLLAFALFISCCGTAFCLGALAYTLQMGKLPFNIQMNPPPPEQPKEAKEEVSSVRKGEIFAEELYAQLKAEREKVVAKNAELEQRERHINELSDNAKKLQEMVNATEQKVKDLMIKIDKTEKENIMRMVKIIEGLEPKSSGKMLTQMLSSEPKMVPRIFYYMKKDKASEVLGSIIDTSDKKKLEEAVKLAMDIQRIEETGK